MKDIKVKETNTKPRIRTTASRMPKELVRKTVLETKEKSRKLSDVTERETGAESPTEYASGKITMAEERIGSEAGSAIYRGGRKMAEKVRQKKQEQKKEQQSTQTVREAQEQAETDVQTDRARQSEGSKIRTREWETVQADGQTGQKTEVGNFAQKELKKKQAVKQRLGKELIEAEDISSVQRVGAVERTDIRIQGKGRSTEGSGTAPVRIKTKPSAKEFLPVSQNGTIKTAPRIVKTSALSIETPGMQHAIQKKQAKKLAKTAQQAVIRSMQQTKNAAKASKTTARGITAAAKATATAIKSMFAVFGAVGGIIIALLIVIVGIIGGAAFSGNSQSAKPLTQEVISYTPVIQKYAAQYGIPEYVDVIKAIMMQESAGQGTDPMQSSECPYNTRFPNTPGAITEPEYSIQVGIQYYADCIKEAGCKSPQDMDKLKLSLQGYNYGNGYITWAIRNYGGYSEANALQFSQEQAAAHGWARYGDPEYVPHVLQYYAGGGGFLTGLFGNSQIVSVALSQLGNEGGQKFWSWYGFDHHVAWCACFASWCADQSGLITSGVVPKFSLCDDGIAWFKAQNKWQGSSFTPAPGTYIFFDWLRGGVRDGISDHVGIVEKCEGGIVYTVEGNSGNAVQQNSYPIGDASIMGYGLVY